MNLMYKWITLLLLAVPTCCIPVNAVNSHSQQIYNIIYINIGLQKSV